MDNSVITYKKNSDRYVDGCRFSMACFSSIMKRSDDQERFSFIEHPDPFRKKMFIFRENDPFSAIYMVRSGFVKLFKIYSDGESRVSGFCFPGDIFGFEGLSTNKYTKSAVAVDTTSVCKLGFNDLPNLFRVDMDVQKYLFKAISQKIIEEQERIMWISKRSSGQRVALLLLDVSEKYARMRMSASVFNFPISRSDIACYLGLTVETASRVFTKMQRDGLISINGKEITLLDKGRLNALAAGDDDEV